MVKKKKIRVGIVDYGMGNLHSVSKAFATQGDHVVVSDSVRILKVSDLLVLPGVGAFGAAMVTLAKKRLDDFIRSWIDDKKSYVGICLGFQLLFERSEESRGQKGLSVFKGSVVPFKPRDFGKSQFNIPHMGWNSVSVENESAKKVLSGIDSRDSFYFVHTYFPEPLDHSIVATTTTYGRKFCSSVAQENLFASQFHPEKSGNVGLQLIKNVLTKGRFL